MRNESLSRLTDFSCLNSRLILSHYYSHRVSPPYDSEHSVVSVSSPLFTSVMGISLVSSLWNSEAPCTALHDSSIAFWRFSHFAYYKLFCRVHNNREKRRPDTIRTHAIIFPLYASKSGTPCRVRCTQQHDNTSVALSFKLILTLFSNWCRPSPGRGPSATPGRASSTEQPFPLCDRTRCPEGSFAPRSCRGTAQNSE